MRLTMLKAKLHKAQVTHAVLDYEGSCGISGDLLDLAGIREFEQIQIYNVTTGTRFTTYAIRCEEGTGTISVNGAAAHLAGVGDTVIICAYAEYEEKEMAKFKPTLVYMTDKNEVSHTNDVLPVQVA